MNYKVVHVTKAVQSSTVQSRTSTCTLSTVKFVSASKFWSLVILFFPRNRLSRWAKVSMFSIACKRTTGDSVIAVTQNSNLFIAALLRNTSLLTPAHKVPTKGSLLTQGQGERRTPCSDSDPVGQLACGNPSHQFLARVTSLCPGCRLHNPEGKSRERKCSRSTEYNISWAMRHIQGRRYSFVKQDKHVTSEWQENLGGENTIFKFCDYITQPETTYLAPLHNSFSVISKVNCFMGVCVNIFSYWLYIHTTGRIHRH